MKRRIYAYVPYIVLLILGLLFVLRAFRGFDWSDETYYPALAYRFVLGDPTFLTSWDIHQFSAIIMFPIVYLYKVIVGNMDGIVLSLRFFYILSATVTSTVVFTILKKHMQSIYALVVSALLLIAPFCVHTFSYNTIPILCFVIAFVVLINNQTRLNKIQCCISGFFCAVGVMAYPPTLIVIPCFITYFLIKRKEPQVCKCFFMYIAGMVAVAGLFFIFVIFNSSIGNFISNVRYLFIDPEHQQRYSFVAYFGGIIYSIGKPIVIGMSLITLIVAVCSYRHIPSKHSELYKTLTCVIGAIAIGIFIINIVVCVEKRVLATNLLSMAIPTFAPMLFFMNNRKWHFSILLYCIGICFSIAVSIGSNNGVNGYSFPFLLSTMATIIYFSTMLSSTSIKRVWKNIIACSVAVFAGLMIILNVVPVYRDAPISELRTKMEVGPALGIYTTRESAAKYEDLISTINTYMPKEGNQLYVNLLPFGYLCSEALPGTPRLWRTNLSYEGFSEYYNINPQKIPTAIFIVDESYGISNGRVVYDNYFNNDFMRDHYKKIATKAGTILLMKTENMD